ncbi:MAG: hypothetical protein IKN83_04820 [Bacteroidaceae bacterium]|nr:hypothetical protein [Bacteroidaceae bacterium]
MNQTHGSANPLMRLAYAELKVQTILYGAAPSLALTDGGMDGKKGASHTTKKGDSEMWKWGD